MENNNMNAIWEIPQDDIETGNGPTNLKENFKTISSILKVWKLL
jgi:hypothetical protein